MSPTRAADPNVIRGSLLDEASLINRIVRDLRNVDPDILLLDDGRVIGHTPDSSGFWRLSLSTTGHNCAHRSAGKPPCLMDNLRYP
jgi:hypothetical protein